MTQVDTIEEAPSLSYEARKKTEAEALLRSLSDQQLRAIAAIDEFVRIQRVTLRALSRKEIIEVGPGGALVITDHGHQMLWHGAAAYNELMADLRARETP